MLLAAVQHVKEQHGDVKRLWGKLYGGRNLTTSAIARMNLFLHGIEDFQIVRGDTLRNPAFYDVDRLATFDCVIANPPFSLEKCGRRAVGERSLRAQLRRCARRPVPATSPGSSTWSSPWPRATGAWLWSCRREHCSAREWKGPSARSCWKWI